MARWSEVEDEAPDLAALARERLEAYTHLTLATLRRDGSPRISGTEIRFTDGDLWIGSMWQARKALDLQRDPRFALHSGSPDPTDPADWEGDAKVAGRFEEIEDPGTKKAVIGDEAPPGPNHLFRADIAELVVVRVGDPQDHLVIEAWHEGRGTDRVERR